MLGVRYLATLAVGDCCRNSAARSSLKVNASHLRLFWGSARQSAPRNFNVGDEDWNKLSPADHAVAGIGQRLQFIGNCRRLGHLDYRGAASCLWRRRQRQQVAGTQTDIAPCYRLADRLQAVPWLQAGSFDSLGRIGMDRAVSI